jgi:hypothetical protein
MRTMMTLLIALLGIGSTPDVLAQEKGLVGHWEGVVVLALAEQELDVVADFNGVGGQITGQVRFPLTADGAHAVEGLSARDSHVSFSVRDKDGVVSAFSGDLSPTGDSLQGTMEERGRSLPFTLSRAKAPEPIHEVPTYKLAGDSIQLKAAFNDDADKTRILLLLNLGSFSSKMALRVVQHYVLDQIKDPNLRVYVIWMAPDVPEAAKILQQDTALAADSRVTHFWATDPSFTDTLAPVLASYRPLTNLCLVFAPGRVWGATPPVPDQVRQSPKAGTKAQIAPGQRLNGIALSSDVRSLLRSQRATR